MLAVCALPALATIILAQSSPFDPCPISCSKAGHGPSAWTHLHGERALKRCNQTVLFDTSMFPSTPRMLTLPSGPARRRRRTRSSRLSILQFPLPLTSREPLTSIAGTNRPRRECEAAEKERQPIKTPPRLSCSAGVAVMEMKPWTRSSQQPLNLNLGWHLGMTAAPP